MKNINKILNGLKSKRDYKKIHTETIVELYLTNEDIDPDEFFEAIETYCERVSDTYIIVKKQVDKEITKQQANNPELTASHIEEGLYTASDMEKPWEIIEDLGFMIFQDANSTKNSFYLKSYDRVNGRKVTITKSDEKSLIPLLNSWAYEQDAKWLKPTKVNGQVVGHDDTIVDFRESNLTRFSHKTVVFDPKTASNITEWEGQEALNSYSAPTILSFKKKNNVNGAWPVELADFFRLIWNLVDEDSEGQIYVINWLSRNYQVKDVAQTLLWFCGEGGTGKGILMDLISNIYGSEFIGKGTPENNIFTAKENVLLKNKLYYHADELRLNTEDYEQIKSFVSNRTFTLKANFENVRDYPNYSAFIFNSNTRKGQIPFALPSEKDRRVSAFDTFTTLNDCNWWNFKTSPDKFKYDKDFAKGVAQFLADFKFNDNMLQSPFDNNLRKRMTTAGKPNMLIFAEALATRDMEWFHNMGLDSFDWINSDGRRAASYTWEEHLNDAFNDGFIRTSSSKELYRLIFDDKEYKKEDMAEVGIVEKIKRIEIADSIKSVKMFVLPTDDTEEVKVVPTEQIDEAIETVMKPAKKGGKINLRTTKNTKSPRLF